MISTSASSGDARRALAALGGDETGCAHASRLPEGGADKLLRYLELLAKWNRVYNLTAITDPAQMLTHHVLDSLAIAAPLDAVVEGKAQPQILDVGSGAGLPGIPLAIARPEWSITLIDSNGKKAAFMQQAAVELALPNVTVITGRVEHCTTALFDVIVSRAFASLSDFVDRTRPLIAQGGKWAAMKGTLPADEIAALPAGVRCADVIPLRVPGLDAERHLLLLEVNEA